MSAAPERHEPRAYCDRGAADLSNLTGFVSKVMRGYGYITTEMPVRRSVFFHRSSVVNPRPNDPNPFPLTPINSEAAVEMVVACMGAVIREEIQALKLELLRQMGIVPADVNMRANKGNASLCAADVTSSSPPCLAAQTTTVPRWRKLDGDRRGRLTHVTTPQEDDMHIIREMIDDGTRAVLGELTALRRNLANYLDVAYKRWQKLEPFLQAPPKVLLLTVLPDIFR
ncbi:hypothetical protein HPB50_020502 [Hyalomma asiaticum]|uniref:Uncharacterized protein n=1 Tax=Hyalomma asiaticum TaxID=266040 RepID=A0ACB7RNP2_HYAAI|nr:hypothetical protein HPB50_020502 [Hyalomma asiaticum]